jgi:nucleoside-diphosphate-sugar epimerase
MSKTILITGGAGFLGVNLVKILLNSTTDINRIIVLDNCITGNENNLQTVKELYDTNDVVRFYKVDICESVVLENLKAMYYTIHEIYHFASLASPPFYKRFPLQTLDVGYIGTRNVLELARYYENCKVLFASTSEVYGDPTVHPQKETYYGNVNTVGLRSAYDESKRVGETLCYTYNQLYGVDTRIVRIFNTYGPYMNLHDGRIVTETIRCLKDGAMLSIYGDGNQTRTLSYVDDTMGMIIRVMASNYKEPINVGGDTEYTINKLVSAISDIYTETYGEAILNKKHIAIDIDDPKIRKPCLILNKSVIGETFRTPLRIGISRTIAYFKE